MDILGDETLAPDGPPDEYLIPQAMTLGPDGLPNEYLIAQAIQKIDREREGQREMGHQPDPETAVKVIAEDEGDNCRICRGERTDTQPLFYPCKCSGSIKFVHQDCLMEWLAHSQKKYCELCKTPFRFTKLYDQSMPSSLPLPLFLQQMAIYGIRAISRWTRYALVGLVWLCWLPWSIRQVWRGLFWLADGSWISESDIREAMMARAAEVAVSNGNTLLNATNTTGLALNATLREVVTKALPQVIAPISSFLGLPSGEFLLVKLARLMYPNLFLWSQNLASANTTDDRLLSFASDRQPSLLSGIKFLNSLTGYSILDNAIVDIFEGQLVCLLIVTAFILVFLIREWVINQQPILNMPDPDRVEDVVAPARVNAEAGPPPRRRRRNLRRVLDLPAQAENPQRPVGVPIPRRAATEDNLARPNPPNRGDSPAPLTRSMSFHPRPAGYRDPIDGILDLDTIDSSSQPLSFTESRPPTLSRGAFDDAASIRRRLEEAESSDDDASTRALPPTPLPASMSRRRSPSSTNLAVETLGVQERNNFLDDGGVTARQQVRGHVSFELIDGDDYGESVELEGSDQTAYFQMDEHSDLRPLVRRPSTEDLWIPTPLPNREITEDVFHRHVDQSSNHSEPATPISTDPEVPDTISNHEFQDQSGPSLGDNNSESAVAQPGHPSLLEQLVAWLWETDAYVPTMVETPIADDVHVVEDLDAEDPFVPVENAERNFVDEHNHEPVRIVEAQQANVQFGVDFNNPDAMDDAEDLDGILELIGVHGPIFAMVQNVIFSEFLITLTIAASVWLPYIWGKITLVILANPIGVFIKAPIYLASKSADVAVDLFILLFSLLGYAFSSFGYFINLLLRPLIPGLSSILRTPYLQSASWDFVRSSGGRLQKALSLTAHGIKPDLPSFSMQSHHALVVFQKWASTIMFSIGSQGAGDLTSILRQNLGSAVPPRFDTSELFQGVINLPEAIGSTFTTVNAVFQDFLSDLKPLAFSDLENLDLALMKWSTQDKIVAIVLGYMFFSFIGWMYLKIARLVMGLRAEEKVDGIVADCLTQAGGVMKVVVIIGIEMIVFPLYCGLLLDVAFMPLFQGVTLRSRTAFMLRAPITGLFVHWFIGTCYMFHFALFVSMCRKIMRKGVLYFIRDPDDPTFHPVRDVLERPVATQLGKIAFSALIYGGLVIVCLGGVVWSVAISSKVLPIQWATSEPRTAFPVDVIFYNFMLPFIVRKADPSTKISVMYKWWLRGCASGLRLTHFLFGEEKEEEKGTHVRRTWRALFRLRHGDVKNPVIGEYRRILADDRGVDAYFYRDGSYVRTPASDSVRIPKGGRVFVQVTEQNERVDGEPDQEKGMHGKTDDRFTMVYIPPNFQARIAAFVFLLWVFAASTGVAFTIIPLLVGRRTIQIIARSNLPPNDLYALTLGLHICGAIGYAFSYRRAAMQWLEANAGHYVKNLGHVLPQLYSTTKYVLGLIYLGFTFGILLPFACSLLTEIYLHVPLYAYLTFSPKAVAKALSSGESAELRGISATIYILQTWTLGLLYLRLALRMAMNLPSPHTRVATAIRSIVRDGWTHPDVKLATRAVIVPACLVFALLLLLPLSFARGLIRIFQVTDPDSSANIYRYAYPGLLALGLGVHCGLLLRRQISQWRVKIRDEVYLIGERLHNFNEAKKAQAGERRKGKGKQRAASSVNVGVGADVGRAAAAGVP